MIFLVSDLLDAPKRARVYSKIDLHSTYHLIRIIEDDKWKTIFYTHYSSYKWLVMPFGLMNVPLAFQYLMNKLFADILGMYIIIYSNNILIYSDNIAEHRKPIREVLCWLHANGLYILSNKYVFHYNKIEFLGFILDLYGVQMDDSKISIIQKWPMFWYLKDIQVFLGFANFYRYFIYSYSRIVTLFTQLTHKLVSWN